MPYCIVVCSFVFRHRSEECGQSRNNGAVGPVHRRRLLSSTSKIPWYFHDFFRSANIVSGPYVVRRIVPQASWCGRAARVQTRTQDSVQELNTCSSLGRVEYPNATSLSVAILFEILTPAATFASMLSSSVAGARISLSAGYRFCSWS